MELEIFKSQLRSMLLKDAAGNKFLFARQTPYWIALKGPFDVYFTLACEAYPKVKVMLSLEDNVIPKRAELIKNCELINDIVVENNAKRRKDVFSKEYEFVDKKTMETLINTEFMPLLKVVRDELSGKNRIA